MRLIEADERLVPVVISTYHENSSSLVSFIAQQVSYPLIFLSEHRWLGWLARIARRPLELAARLAGLDEVAHVNNWLLGGPQLQFPARTWRAIAGLIAAEYPRHAVLVRDVIPELNPGQLEEMALAGGLAFPSRRIHLFDPAPFKGGEARASVRRQINRARTLLEKARRERVSRAPQSGEDFSRIEALHHSFYSDRYAINIHYSAEFFRAVAALDGARLSLWEDDAGTVESFDAVVSDGSMVTWTTCGADSEAKVRKGYYQLAFASILEEALGGSQIANLGLGADEFKSLRGSQPATEWDVAFIDHLPLPQRMTWRAIAGLRRLRLKTSAALRANGAPNEDKAGGNG